MGWRYRRSSKIGPFRINFSKSGIGWSVGGKGYRYTKKAGGGTRTTIKTPIKGLSYVSETGGRKSASRSGGSARSASLRVMENPEASDYPLSSPRKDEDSPRWKPAPRRGFRIAGWIFCIFALITLISSPMMDSDAEGSGTQGSTTAVLLFYLGLTLAFMFYSVFPKNVERIKIKDWVCPISKKWVFALIITLVGILPMIIFSWSNPSDNSSAVVSASDRSAYVSASDIVTGSDTASASDQLESTTASATTTTNTTTEKTTAPSVVPYDELSRTIVLNTNTHVYHLNPNCRAVSHMKEKNKNIVESSIKEVEAKGYHACDICSN